MVPGTFDRIKRAHFILIRERDQQVKLLFLLLSFSAGKFLLRPAAPEANYTCLQAANFRRWKSEESGSRSPLTSTSYLSGS